MRKRIFNAPPRRWRPPRRSGLPKGARCFPAGKRIPSALVKEITTTKFDASVDVDVRLGVDPRKANQMVRGVVSLPHGTGKQVRVLALCTPDKEAEATAAGADYVGLDEYIEKLKSGWTDIDIIITMPAIMGKIGALGRILGPRGLMPNPKSVCDKNADWRRADVQSLIL